MHPAISAWLLHGVSCKGELPLQQGGRHDMGQTLMLCRGKKEEQADWILIRICTGKKLSPKAFTVVH